MKRNFIALITLLGIMSCASVTTEEGSRVVEMHHTNPLTAMCTVVKDETYNSNGWFSGEDKFVNHFKNQAAELGANTIFTPLENKGYNVYRTIMLDCPKSVHLGDIAYIKQQCLKQDNQSACSAARDWYHIRRNIREAAEISKHACNKLNDEAQCALTRDFYTKYNLCYEKNSVNSCMDISMRAYELKEIGLAIGYATQGCRISSKACRVVEMLREAKESQDRDAYRRQLASQQEIHMMNQQNLMNEQQQFYQNMNREYNNKVMKEFLKNIGGGY
ncbi:hypothetical protein ACRXCV_03305 [Halobacteriovorax sp. GFR7]|uniref:hypothetical protein n=1 Tax=unclassified Halobacteriovorax TaxID=2639665 RepID=UPI003D98DE1F